MKKLLILLPVLLFCSLSWSQTPIDATGEGYSNWHFVNSDKALQSRYKEVKQENDISYFEVQFRINSEDEIYCGHAICLGYLLLFSYPTLDNTTNIESSYKFYNSFTGIYTLPEPIPLTMSFPNGSRRMLRQEGFFYTTAESSEELPARFFSNCVDNIIANSNDHRCKPYYSNFKEEEAIVIQ